MGRVARALRWRWAMVALGTALAGCQGSIPDLIELGIACDADHPCREGQVCDPHARLCVAVPPPSILVQRPTTGVLLPGQRFRLSGSVTSLDSAPVTAEASVGAEDVWHPLPLGAGGAFDQELPLPDIDGQLLRVRIRARTSRQESTRTVYPIVDNVAPAVIPTPPLVAFMPPTIGLLFSEPVTSTNEIPASISPGALPGAWNADRTVFRYTSLVGDTRYALRMPPTPVWDRAGNLAELGLSMDVNTRPVLPSPGQILAVDGQEISSFEAAFDDDGVLSVAAIVGNTPPSLLWGAFNTRTGRFEMLATVPAPGLKNLQVVAGKVDAPGQPPRRSAGMFLERQRPGMAGVTLRSAYWRVAGGPVQVEPTSGYAVVPLPGGCGEGAIDPVAVALQSEAGAPLLRRAGVGDVPLTPGFTPRYVAPRSPNAWEWFSVSGNTLQRQRRLCTCGTGCGFLAPEGVRSDLAAEPRLSLAVPRGRGRIYVFDALSGERIESCYECQGAEGEGPCALSSQRPLPPGTELFVAPRGLDGKVLGTRRTAAGIELIERDLTSGCAGDWITLGVLQGTAADSRFRPVRVGDRPGILYTAGPSRALHLHVP